MDLDATDRKIIALLQPDGRMSNAELAERVNLSPSACLRRVRQLEEAGVIQGYAMLVDQEAIGLPLNVFVEISLKALTEEALDAFEAAVRDCPAVMASYLMSGDADYLLHMVVPDAAGYERIHRSYLSRFPYVARIRSSFALRTVSKKTAFDLVDEA
ncbi:MAG: Lrp/AsnC family transcriptional regulator [Kiloniellales bacterium]